MQRVEFSSESCEVQSPNLPLLYCETPKSRLKQESLITMASPIKPNKTAQRYLQTDTSKQQRTYLLGILIILLATTALRTINLDADPVSWLVGEVGYQIDEGYKTLSPRNLALFGQTHWNAEDEYSGWMRYSAITQWPYYWSFKVLGPQLSSARAVSIIYTISMLTAIAVFLWKRNSPKAAVLGVLLLATDPGIFLFSRSALFETALTFFTYIPLLLAASAPARLFALLPLLILGTTTAPAFFFLKKTVLIYTAPTALALGWDFVRQKAPQLLNKNFFIAALLAIAACVGIFLQQEPWILKELNIEETLLRPHRIFLNPIHNLSPLAMILGYGVLFELLLRNPKLVFQDAYRLCLASIAVLGPIILSFLIYNYPRYYIPIIPAALLLAVDRLCMDEDLLNTKDERWISFSRIPALLVFLALSMAVLAAINQYVFALLPLNMGEDPGLSDIGLLKVFPVFTAIFAAGIYLVVSKLWNNPGKKIVIAISALAVISGLCIAATAVMKPSYKSREIQSQLLDHVGASESVGGDWAPFFGMNSELRVLYMRPDWNSAAIATDIRPNYFLHSETPYDEKNLQLFRENNAVRLEDPIPLGSFYKHKLTLYPITYLASEMSATPEQPTPE